MVLRSCGPVLALEKLVSHRGGRTRAAARLLGGQDSRRSICLSSPHMQTKMTPKEVNKVLSAKAFSHKELITGPIKYFDTNTLDSNSPSEDSQAEAYINHNRGQLFGIFDGHGGWACGQVVARRLFQYIAAALLPPQELRKHLKALERDDETDPNRHLIRPFNEDHYEVVNDLAKIYGDSYKKYVETLVAKHSEMASNENIKNVEQVLIDSFLSLDNDMSLEAQKAPDEPRVNLKAVNVAVSGCVAAVAYIDGHNLSVAGTGDVTAVVGYLSETDTWMAKKLTNEHNSDNVNEVKRILAEHPDTESHTIIKGDRLLSILAPLRAFGDFKFKWPIATVDKFMRGVFGETGCPPHYKSPPYLTARPEVMSHRLAPRDKFLVIGSDGLWDMMTPLQVVRLVGEHINGKSVLRPFEILHENQRLGDISANLKSRQKAMKTKPMDTNAATHLLRNALGGTAYGVDHDRLSHSLSVPKDMVRMQRDDITIQVVFFNEEYLRGNLSRYE